MGFSLRSLFGGSSQDFPGAMDLGAPWYLSSVLSPPILDASTDNYAPTGFDTTNVFLLTVPVAGATLTGIAGGAASRTSRLIIIVNNSTTADTLTLAHQSASSASGNRFVCPGAVNLVIAQFSSAMLWYDVTGGVGHWHVFAWS